MARLRATTCPRALELAAVEKELEAWQEFVERWLKAAESPRPTIRTRESVLSDLAEKISAMHCPNVTAEQRESVVRVAVSTL
jgi:hypothetical protein